MFCNVAQPTSADTDVGAQIQVATDGIFTRVHSAFDEDDAPPPLTPPAARRSRPLKIFRLPLTQRAVNSPPPQPAAAVVDKPKLRTIKLIPIGGGSAPIRIVHEARPSSTGKPTTTPAPTRKPVAVKRRRNGGRASAAEVAHEAVFAPETCARGKTAPVEVGGATPCWLQVANEAIVGCVESTTPREVAAWSSERVAEMVACLPFGSRALAHKFQEQLIDGEALLLLTQDDLTQHLQMPLGPALKMINVVQRLKHCH